MARVKTSSCSMSLNVKYLSVMLIIQGAHKSSINGIEFIKMEVQSKVLLFQFLLYLVAYAAKSIEYLKFQVLYLVKQKYPRAARHSCVCWSALLIKSLVVNELCRSLTNTSSGVTTTPATPSANYRSYCFLNEKSPD